MNAAESPPPLAVLHLGSENQEIQARATVIKKAEQESKDEKSKRDSFRVASSFAIQSTDGVASMFSIPRGRPLVLTKSKQASDEKAN